MAAEGGFLVLTPECWIHPLGGCVCDVQLTMGLFGKQASGVGARLTPKNRHADPGIKRTGRSADASYV